MIVKGKKYDSVWVAYSKKHPYLPIAIADSAEELAEIVGVKTSTVEAMWSKFWRGKISRTRYAWVLIEEDK